MDIHYNSYSSSLLRMGSFLIDTIIVIIIILIILTSPIHSYWEEYLRLIFKESQPYIFYILSSSTIYPMMIIIIMAFVPLINSPGKLLCGNRIVNKNHNKITYFKSILRTITKFSLLLIAFLLIDFQQYRMSPYSKITLGSQIYGMFALGFIFLFILSNFVAVFDKQNRTIHDRICGTYVIKKILTSNNPI